MAGLWGLAHTKLLQQISLQFRKSRQLRRLGQAARLMQQTHQRLMQQTHQL
jgi:hypothetical protein